MRRNYMDTYEQILQSRISQSKKERLKLLRSRPKRYSRDSQSMILQKLPEPKPKQYSVAYIENAVKIMKESQNAMLQNPSLPIRIDNAYGDYAMSVFRRKDKIKRLEDIPKLFTNDFKTKIIDCFPPGCDKLVDDLIKGRIKASSLTPKPSHKFDDFEQVDNKKKHYKDLLELNEEMKYECFVQEQPSQSSRAKIIQKEDNTRSSSVDKFAEKHNHKGFLPQIIKVKKGLIFRGQN